MYFCEYNQNNHLKKKYFLLILKIKITLYKNIIINECQKKR